MSITPSLFKSNSLAGEIVVVNNHANISIPLETFAFLGDKNLRVKLRRNSTSGDVLKESPQITIKDYAEVDDFFTPVNYVLEGSALVFTLRTANVVNDSLVHYTVTPIHANVNSNDFSSNLTGYVRIENNVGRFSVTANADSSPLSEDGENFNVVLRAGGPTGDIITSSANIEIVDTSSTVPGELTANATIFLEGSSIVFTIDPAYYTDGTSLYYKTVGNVTSSNFVQSNLSTHAVQSNVFSLTLDIASVMATDEERNFYLEVREDYQGGTLVGRSPNISILHQSMQYTSASGGIISYTTDNGTKYKIHSFRNTAPGSYNTTTSTATYPSTTWVNNYGGEQQFKIDRLPFDNTTQLEYLLVAAGGAGGELNTGSSTGYWIGGGGGGGGGVITGQLTMDSTLATNVTVGIGQGTFSSGGPSYISEWNLTALGGGKGGRVNTPISPSLARNGGTGGGQGFGAPPDTYPAPPGVIKSFSPIGQSTDTSQGSPGLGTGTTVGLGGGGGGGGPALAKIYPSSYVANSSGVPGFESSITGTATFYGGGGGGGKTYPYRSSSIAGLGGSGGGGRGGYAMPPSTVVPRSVPALNGQSHLGGGGGGMIKASPEPAGFGSHPGGRGGPGTVILRYPIGPA